MKFAILAASIATLAPLASASGSYQATWTIQGDACGGQISLGEFAEAETCTPKDCAPLSPAVTGFSTKTQCVEVFEIASNDAFGNSSKPFVLVEVFPANSSCTGEYAAVGVIADGTCYPSAGGKASYNVTWSAEAGTVWLQYDDALCKGKETKVEIPNASANGDTCLLGNLKAYAIAPGALINVEEYIDVSETDEYEDAPAGAAGNASSPSNSSTTAPAGAATPAPTTSAASTSVSVAFAVGVSAMAAIASAVVM